MAASALGETGQRGCRRRIRGHAVAGLLPLGDPAPDLAGQESVRPAEVAQPDGVRVHGVQRHEHVDQRLLARRRSSSVLAQPGGSCSQRYDALDELHHVAGRVDRWPVLRRRQHPRHRDGGAGQRRDDAPFAAHVVRRGRHLAHRRAAQHDRPGRAVDAVGQVRAAVPIGRERAAAPALVAELSGEPGADVGGVGTRHRHGAAACAIVALGRDCHAANPNRAYGRHLWATRAGRRMVGGLGYPSAPPGELHRSRAR